MKTNDVFPWTGHKMIVCIQHAIFIGPTTAAIISYATKAQFSNIEILVSMPMTRLLIRIVPCLAGGYTSATCLMILVMRPAKGQ